MFLAPLLSYFLKNESVEAVNKRAVSPHGQAVSSLVICAWEVLPF